MVWVRSLTRPSCHCLYAKLMKYFTKEMNEIVFSNLHTRGAALFHLLPEAKIDIKYLEFTFSIFMQFVIREPAQNVTCPLKTLVTG